MKLMVSEIIEAIEGIPLNFASDGIITSFSTDSRNIRKGEAYIALKGERFDGNDYVFDAAAKGAGMVILNNRSLGKSLLERYGSLAIAYVEDGTQALQKIASHWRRQLKGKVLLLTGSNGKTTTKEMLAAVLKTKYRIAITPENKNNLIGLPQTLLTVPEETEIVILEAGMNHEGEIRTLAETAVPDLGLILNVAPAHIGHFDSVDAVCNAKWELVEVMNGKGKIFINGDNPSLLRKSEGWQGLSLYGANRNGIEVRNVYVSKKGTTFEIIENGKSVFFTLQLIGKHFVSNVLATLAVAKEFGFTTEEVAEALKVFTGVKNRFSVRCEKEWEIINDAYNANPASMMAGIEAVHDIRNGIPTWYVLGDMGELGDKASSYHEEVGAFIAEKIKNDERKPKFLFVGEMGKIIGESLAERIGKLPLGNVPSILYCKDQGDAVNILKKECRENSRVYLKASNSMNLYKIEEGLLS